jgi:serine protease Do
MISFRHGTISLAILFAVSNFAIASFAGTAFADKTDLSEMMPKNLFIDLGKRVNPAVVNISTTQTLRGGMQGGGGGYPSMPMPNDPFQQFFNQFMGPQGPQQQEEKVQSLGSGFIIESDGLILTNNHVIQNATEIRVQLTEKSKRTYKAKVVGADARTDIALIRITANEKLPFVALGDSDKVEVGEWVAAFGNPFGHGHSMTKGIISAKDRDIELENSYPFLQTDASINPGNSGGPLVNTAGEVIGINAAIDARAQGIGFAIPINIVKKLLPTLKTAGHITRGFLGVGINNIDERMTKQLSLKDDRGAIVLSVSPGSPAAKAGVQNYDVITKFAGKDVDGARSLTNTVGETPIGETVTMSLIRDGRPMDVKVKIAERTDEEYANRNEDGGPSGHRGLGLPHNLGMNVVDLNASIAKELELQDAPAHGAVIVSVKPNGLASQAGAQPGDIILDVNKHAVNSAKEAAKFTKSGTNSMRIQRGSQVIIIFMGG